MPDAFSKIILLIVSRKNILSYLALLDHVEVKEITYSTVSVMFISFALTHERKKD